MIEREINYVGLSSSIGNVKLPNFSSDNLHSVFRHEIMEKTFTSTYNNLTTVAGKEDS